MEIIKNCKICGNDFSAKSDKAKFCSNACKVKDYKKRKKLKVEHENKLFVEEERHDSLIFQEKLENLEQKQSNLEQDFMKGTMSLVESFVSRSEIEYLKEDIKENRSLIKKLIETNDTILKENLILKDDNRKMEDSFLEINRAFRHLKEDIERFVRIQEEKEENNSESANENFSVIIEKLMGNEKLIDKLLSSKKK